MYTHTSITFPQKCCPPRTVFPFISESQKDCCPSLSPVPIALSLACSPFFSSFGNRERKVPKTGNGSLKHGRKTKTVPVPKNRSFQRRLRQPNKLRKKIGAQKRQLSWEAFKCSFCWAGGFIVDPGRNDSKNGKSKGENHQTIVTIYSLHQFLMYLHDFSCLRALTI